MMGEPSNANIQLLASLIGVTPAESIKWLKAHDDNVNTAVNAFYDNPDSIPNDDTWDESQFHADKTGNTQSAFTVHPQDTLKPSVFDAPSRPPSRVSTKAGAPLDHAGGSNKQLSVREQENEDLKRALTISMNQAIPGQESGVTNAQGPQFGPATRPHYDNESWVMTTAPISSTREIFLNPEPVDRRREAHTPAFLKPMSDRTPLAALIKILQAIPLSREALLNRDYMIQDYGYDDNWWNGTPIQAPSFVNVVRDGLDPDHEELIRETQRLIAFLEGTDRAYGSVDTLSNLPDVRDPGDHRMVASYLTSWRSASFQISPANPLLDIFQTTGVKTQTCEPRTGEMHDFYVLELRVDETLADRGQTLYEAIDDIMWSDQGVSTYEDVCLSDVGDVFVIEVERVREGKRGSMAGSGLGIKIPAVWYSDRYLESSIPQVKEMQAGKNVVKQGVAKFDEAKEEILRCQTSSMLNVADSPSFLNTATAFFERSVSNEENINGSQNVQGDVPSSPELKKHSMIAKELKSLTARIAQKLKTIEESKKPAQEKLDELSRLYTRPTYPSENPPHHKYTLRGVRTTPSTVYVLEKTQPDIENDMLSTEAKDWQWWKLKYEGRDSKPVSQTKVREIEVLKAAKDESDKALLVYANEKAVSYEVEALPPPLQNLVQLDNLSFAAELQRAAPPKPTASPKRKAEDNDDEENVDLLSKFYHSPEQEENIVLPQAADTSDPTLPAYAPTSPSPPFSPTRPSRTPTRNLRKPSTYDDLIPRTLRATDPTMDPSSMMMLDHEDSSNEGGQEMQDRGVGIGMLRQQDGMLDGRRYILGSYVPEIRMEDGEDSDGEEAPHSRHVGFGNDGSPRQ